MSVAVSHDVENKKMKILCCSGV